MADDAEDRSHTIQMDEIQLRGRTDHGVQIDLVVAARQLDTEWKQLADPSYPENFVTPQIHWKIPGTEGESCFTRVRKVVVMVHLLFERIEADAFASPAACSSTGNPQCQDPGIPRGGLSDAAPASLRGHTLPC